MKNRLTIWMVLCWGSTLWSQTGIHITNGANLYLNGDIHLVLHNADLENNGILEGSGAHTVALEGNTIAGLFGSPVFTFYNLKINKENDAEVLLNADIIVENELDISQGRLNLNGQIIQLEGHIMHENEDNYITGINGGYIELVTSLNNPNQANPGNMGIAITSTADLGNTTIHRGHVQPTSSDGGHGIYRYFNIMPENNTNLDATLRMYYHDDELAAIPESELNLWRSNDGGLSWELVGVSDFDITNNYVEQWGIDAFSKWTLGSATTAALPVELLTFRGWAKPDANLLEWTTSSEENLSHFQVEKLIQSKWELIGEVDAMHFSTMEQTYHFLDRYIGAQEYYRLRMVDFDASETFSKIINITRIGPDDPVVTIFPNPVLEQLTLTLSEGVEVISIRIMDATGQEVQVYISAEHSLNVSKFPSGIYYLEVQTTEGRYLEKITKI